jgi:hypothetical protein
MNEHDETEQAYKKGYQQGVKDLAERVKEKTEKARQKYQRLCKEQGEKEDEAMNIHFRGIAKIVDQIAKEMGVE